MTNEQSLNLSDRYVPQWGVWEVAREIICNARDEGEYDTETPDANTLIVTSNSSPPLSVLTVIGAGTKCNDGKTIGQFGEGFKLAALTVCRMGGTMVVETKHYRAEFFLKDVDGFKVLHVRSNTWNSTTNKCIVTINLNGIGLEHHGKFLTRDPLSNNFHSTFMIPRDSIKPPRIYIKGVFVNSLNNEASIADWNLGTATLNRDRSMVDAYSCQYAIATYFNFYLTPETFMLLLRNPTCFELKSLYTYCTSLSDRLKCMIWETLQKQHGENMVIASNNDRANYKARAAGKKPVVTPDYIAHILKGTGAYADDFRGGDLDVEIVSDNRPELRELSTILDILDAPCNITIFRSDVPDKMGIFDPKTTTIMLNERLFEGGRRHMRISTFLHEVAHMLSGSEDMTPEFQDSLSDIAAKMYLLRAGYEH